MAQAGHHSTTGDVIEGAETLRGPKSWVVLLGFLVLAFLAYEPAWHAGFIWDDDDHLTANPAMTAPHGLRMIWTSIPVSRYYPLTLTSFWMQRRLWGLDPRPYHLVNIALHAANAALVFYILCRLRVPGALLAALIWLLHPVNVESVAWITELKNTQSGLFFFCAVWCFLRSECPAAAAGYPETTRGIPPYKTGEKSAGDSRRYTGLLGIPPYKTAGEWGWYALAVLCGAAAMLSKPSTVVLPLVLLLCVWWERGRWRWADRRPKRPQAGTLALLRTVPFFMLAVGTSFLAVFEQRWQVSRMGPTMARLDAAQRLVIAGKAVWFYAAKLFWPASLAFVYPRWNLETAFPRGWTPLIGLIVVGIVLGHLARRQAACRAAAFGLGYFVAALLPVLGFFDIFYFRYSFVADHFQYLASVGVITLAASAATTISAQWRRVWRILASCVAVVVLGGLTWNQATIYHDVETLWLDTLAKNPGCWMADHNLANRFFQRGDLPDAVAHWEHALQIDPSLTDVGNNLGTALYKLGRVDEAIRRWEQVLRLDGDYFGAHLNLGAALVQRGRVADGIGQLEAAVRIDTNSVEARLSLAAALVHEEKGQQAIPHLEQALRLRPDSVTVLARLAWLLATLPPTEGASPARAVELAQRACELTGNHSAANLDVLAVAYAASGRFDDAMATAQKAVDIARAGSQPNLAREIEGRLKLYRARCAYHPLAARTP
jgi:Tfp pilus assembly protein PilF